LLDDTLIQLARALASPAPRGGADRLGPHFADNFIWAGRFLQISWHCSSVPPREKAIRFLDQAEVGREVSIGVQPTQVAGRIR